MYSHIYEGKRLDFSVIANIHAGLFNNASLHEKLKRIQFFDSMGSSGRPYLQGLLQYLEDEHKDKKKSQLDTSDWELVPCDSDTCPQQENGFDCGVFTCMFAGKLK